VVWYLYFQLTDVYDKQSLKFGTLTDILWYRPSSLSELLSLKGRYCHGRLVSGATTVGLLISHIYCPVNVNDWFVRERVSTFY